MLSRRNCQPCDRTMSRYLYVLFLFFAIRWTLCIDYFSDDNPKRNHDQQHWRKDNLRTRLGRRQKTHKKRPDYEIMDDKEPVAQIDVASFIHKPDEYSIEDNLLYQTDNKKSKSKIGIEDYGYLSGINMAEDLTSGHKRSYFSSEDIVGSNNNLFSHRDSMHPRHFNLDAISIRESGNPETLRNLRFKSADGMYGSDNNIMMNTDTSLVHKPEKKCALKQLKFPFFYHSKNETLKPKKDKKRKLYCFKCLNKHWNETKSSSTVSVKDHTKNENTVNVNAVLSTKKTNANRQNHEENIRKNRDARTIDRKRQQKQLQVIQRKIDGEDITDAYQNAYTAF